jgi:hypothetical protein
MQVVINIPDAVLREAIEAQVGAAVAGLTNEIVMAKANAIIATKLERFDPVRVAEAEVRKQLTEQVKNTLQSEFNILLGGGSSYERRKKLEEILTNAAKQLLRGEAGK